LALSLAPEKATPHVPERRVATNRVALFFLLSALLLVPCFWQPHIEAGDLASHVYNTWLAQLAQQGKAPGVYVVWQSNNVLFDLLLFNLAKLFNIAAAERIAASLCVLIFFWGVFALIKAATKQSPWFLTPCIAILTYGFTFQMGFMNYYLSIGLACCGLALLWEGKGMGLLAALALAPFVLLAHPLGFLWFLSTGAYRLLWPKLKSWTELLPPSAALVVTLEARWLVLRQAGNNIEWPEGHFFYWNGSDQFSLFDENYSYFQYAIALIVVLAVLLDLWSKRRATQLQAPDWKDRRLLLQLYAVTFCVIALLPENVRPSPTSGWIGYLVSRLTLISAIFALCYLGSLRPQRWHLFGFTVCACVFFFYFHKDAAFLNRIEENAERITRTLPFGTRVTSSVFAPPDYREESLHLVDRACIGHCFLISNYEPATKQFRVRVSEASPVVTSSVDDSEDMQSGVYEVQDEDLPLKQIYQCDPADLTKLCIRNLSAKEKNGAQGYNPNNGSPQP
jgi:hypothetical protein